jgi:signal peptidase II
MLAAITLIIAGGIGNLIDRIAQGYVVDFIELRFINFAIFNFADMCAVVGAFLMVAIVIGEEVRDYRAKRACAPEESPPKTEKESDAS